MMNAKLENRNPELIPGRERARDFSFSASTPSPIGWERVAAGRVRGILLFALLTQLSTLNPQLAAATFTNAVTISETNTNYDGQDIIVDGATVTIDGLHSFNSVLLTINAVLTHSPCTTTNTHKLDLTITNQIVVSTNSRIDVSGRGYVAGRTSGNTTNGAATGQSGGSYGGLGGSANLLSS